MYLTVRVKQGAEREGKGKRPTSMSVVYEILPECHGWGFAEWGIRDLI
jgi:hypothetical protein